MAESVEDAVSCTALAGAFGESAGVLGLTANPSRVSAELKELLGEPLELFDKHTHWPSAASPSGIPFEFSAVVGGGDEVALRYAIDYTDHSSGLQVNLDRYLNYSQAVTKAPRALLADLISRQLEGIGPFFRTRMMHGVGYGVSGRRSTLYFRAAWMTRDELERRFPLEVAEAEQTLRRFGGTDLQEVEAISRDFAEGSVERTKMYLPVQAETMRGGVLDHPDLNLAKRVLDRYSTPSIESDADALLLQLSPSSGGCSAKLIFMASAWGWGRPDGLASLLDVLGCEHHLPVGRLDAVLRCFGDRQLSLEPTVVALGRSSASFYFCPVPKLGTGGSTGFDAGALLDRLVGGANGYLAAGPDQEDFSGGGLSPGGIDRMVDQLVGKQRVDGGWDGPLPGSGNDLAATAASVSVLRGICESPATRFGTRAKARATLGSAHRRVLAQALGRDPFEIGHWMSAWVGTGGDPNQASLGRMLATLDALQASDGSWADCDESTQATTAAVLKGLVDLKKAWAG